MEAALPAAGNLESPMSLPVPRTSRPNKPTFLRRLLLVSTTIYTILLITRPHEFLPQFAESPILQVLVLFAFGVWLMTSDKGTDLPHFVILPFFLLFIWLSLIAAGWVGGIVPALEKLLPPMLLFVIISGCVRSVSELRIYSTVVIACACVLVLHGHLQVTNGIGWTGEPMIEGRITYSGIFNDPNDMGLLIVVSIALCAFHLRTLRVRLVRWVTAAALCWLLYGVYLTDSRGTMLATMAVLGLEAWRSYGKAVVITAGAVAVPILIAFTRLAELDAEEESAGNRVDAWYEGVQLLTDNPIFGVGYGMFIDYHGLTAHNSLVLAMAELGLTGYTFWVAFVFITGWMIFRLTFPEPRAGGAPLAHAATALPARAAVAGAGADIRRDLWTPPRARAGASASLAHGVETVVESPAAATAGAAVESEDDRMERLASQALLFAATGFAVGAFFLSQSYKPMLFINCGLIVGRYLGMREKGLPVPRVELRLPLMFGITLASVAGIWVLVRVLL
jgi:putative inorganic carbon (hco3(-)) transporter